MATGYYSNNHCYLNVGVAAFMELDSNYPAPLVLANTTAKTATTAGLEVVSSWTVNQGGLITYSTRNNNTNAAMLANKTIQLYTCDTVAFDEDLATNVLDISAAQGTLLAGAILLVWATGYAFRAAIQALSNYERESDENN